MEKLIRALVVSTAATIGAAIVLQRLDQRIPAEIDQGEESQQSGPEVDADQIDPAQRKAMLAELEAQL
ncbi:MAG: hypothetical protein ACI9W4_000056 [Rhodothermales bacterium]